MIPLRPPGNGIASAARLPTLGGVGRLIGFLSLVVPVLAWADPLIVRSGATLKLGNADHPTALEHNFLTIEPGGALELIGEVSIRVAGDITIAGQIVVDPSIRKLKAGAGIPGIDGDSEAGTNGQNGGSGTNMVSGGVITLNLRAEGTVMISGSIDLRAELEGGDGARGGDGAFRPAYIGTPAGSGGAGGHGGFGPARVVINAHTIDLRPSGRILLDSLGRGGKGGDGGNGGLGGSLGITNTKRGGSAGSGGEGGTGGSGGYLTLGAAILRIEGQISLTGGEGGEGGMVGLPGDGGYGGDGGDQPGGNGGDAGNPDGSGPRGGRGGYGGAGGTLTIRATEELVYTTKAKLDGGRSGKPGAGRPAGAAKGGKGGSGNPPGHDGRPSGPLLPGAEGLPGQDAIESLWTGFTPPYWTGPFICSIPFTDTDPEGVLRKGMELCGGHCMSVFFRAEAGAPLELRFEHRWRTATGALVVRFGGHVLYRAEAPGGIPAGFSEVREVLSDLVLFSPFLRPLEICVEPAEARIQISNFVIRRAPELNGPQLVIEGPLTGAGPIGFTWLSTVGQAYQLQTRSSLTSGSWEALGAPVIGTGQSLNVSAPPPSSSSRVYYRLVASPVQ